MSSIKLLILEDSDLDAKLTLRELERMQKDFDTKVVSNQYGFEEEVVNWKPDLIISDFNLQTFKGDEALAFSKKVSPDTPFITLSGSITKEMELTLLKERANDVLTKGDLKKLPYAINRVLNEKKDKIRLKNTLTELEENLRFQEALAEVSLIFNSSEPFEMKVQRALKTIGQVTKVSRVYIFEENEKSTTYTNTFEWCAEGVEPQIDKLKDVPYSESPSLRPILINEGKLFANNIYDLPRDLIEVFEPQDIKALMVFPIYLSDAFFGFIGMDETSCKRTWSDSEDKLIKSVSGIISNAYSENLARLELVEKNNELNQLLKEKEVLVGEVHHRVKNNLALISSFLQLEQMGVSTSGSKEQIISANILRIRSIGIVHETVYQQGSFSNIDVLKVLREIIKVSYAEKAGTKQNISINNSEASATFNINLAVPFSLLISEVLFQALSQKSDRSFLGEREMILAASEEDGRIIVLMEEPRLATVLGKLQEAGQFSEIIEVLAKQIGARFEINPEKGETKISFTDKRVKGASSTFI